MSCQNCPVKIFHYTVALDIHDVGRIYFPSVLIGLPFIENRRERTLYTCDIRIIYDDIIESQSEHRFLAVDEFISKLTGVFVCRLSHEIIGLSPFGVAQAVGHQCERQAVSGIIHAVDETSLAFSH